MAKPVQIIHFSDVLCVWAYVSQVRVDELEQKLGDLVSVDVRFCPVFGDAHGKLEKGWATRGGRSGYGAHVRDIAERFDHPVHPDVWRKVAPRSSLSPHLFLCAVRTAARRRDTALSSDAMRRACWRVRTAFFRDLLDIGGRPTQRALAGELGLPMAEIDACLESGEAHAELSRDYALAQEHAVTVSPTYILNEGRQRLNGNVSFGVIEANVRELIAQNDADQASNC